MEPETTVEELLEFVARVVASQQHAPS